MGSVVYGGLDVHKESISACLINRETGAIVQDQVPNDPAQLLRAVRRWQKLGELRLCYEASGAGYVIKRWLDGEGIACEVIAPSKIPHAPGERIKTDRRDARKLAQLYAAGLLSPVRTPSQAEEQVRAIVRLRDEITRDMTRIKNRIVKHLGRLHIRFEGGRNWTQKHRRWLQKLGLDPAEALILNIHLNTLDHLESQRQELDQKIAVIAEEPTYRDRVQRLLCLRGIQLYSAMVLLTEIGDIARFGSAPQLMSYFGLVPREASSGDTRHLGVSPRPATAGGAGFLDRQPGTKAVDQAVGACANIGAPKPRNWWPSHAGRRSACIRSFGASRPARSAPSRQRRWPANWQASCGRF